MHGEKGLLQTVSHGESGGGGAEALPTPSPATCLGTASARLGGLKENPLKSIQRK